MSEGAVAPASPADRPRRPGPVAVLKTLASVIAPLSIITALMFYFGLLHAYHFFRQFGIDYTVFDLSTQDYVVRSADGLFIPLAVVCLLVLVVAWVYQLLPDAPPGHVTTAARVLVPLLVVVGAVLLLLALWGAVNTNDTDTPFEKVRWFPGLALVGGVLALQGATRVHHWVREQAPDHRGRQAHPVWAATEWTAVIVLVSTGLFWAVGNYSADVGKLRARSVVTQLPTRPYVTVYADQRLALTTPGVRETACSQEEVAGVRYRYDGLRMVLQEGGLLFLVPWDYAHGRDTAIVLPRSAAARLEFSYAWPEDLSC
ncbi:hypothetical protein [Ornithinimicrobium cerasi]|uniref:Uncharacterized protein n=1 Tax=Ornithinimicrobium cerasi TaxID=2248773 RepID=A0A285VE23_9MICO|nr:hypothetical protein [Ornithinimicrobium cerasi]SOC52233.1 hypothetical protein SAMN05421879_101458 [Ornithinimicrobium cerasi]